MQGQEDVLIVAYSNVIRLLDVWKGSYRTGQGIEPVNGKIGWRVRFQG